MFLHFLGYHTKKADKKKEADKFYLGFEDWTKKSPYSFSF